MDEESAPVPGTKVRAGQQIGVVGDTGERREAIRGKFPPYLHFGWYDTSFANFHTDLESGAMNPYPLLRWLESNGGAVTGGANASYCEAPREPTPDSSGTTPDLDTDDRTDAWPSPVVEARDRRSPPEPERQGRTEEKSEGTNERSKEAGATDAKPKASPTVVSEKDAKRGTSAARVPRRAPSRLRWMETGHQGHPPTLPRKTAPRSKQRSGRRYEHS